MHKNNNNNNNNTNNNGGGKNATAGKLNSNKKNKEKYQNLPSKINLAPRPVSLNAAYRRATQVSKNVASEEGLMLAPKKLMIFPYLATRIDPSGFTDVSVPDSINRKHVNKSVLSTNDVVVPAGATQGMFILFPDSTSSIIGAHYAYVSGSWVFQSTLLLSQDLSLYYDFGRKVSQRTDIYTTTLPSGIYALSGTFNAITLDGLVSTLPALNYNGLLGDINNGDDRVAGVKAEDGITILSKGLTFDQEFVRLDDAVPSAVIVPSNSSAMIPVANVINAADSVSYQLMATSNVISSSGTQTFGVRMNVDSITGFSISGNLTVSFAAAVASNTFIQASANIGLVGPFGNVVNIPLPYNNALFNSVTTPNTVSAPNYVFPFSKNFLSEAIVKSGGYIGGINITGSMNANASGQNVQLTLEAIVTVPKGSKSGEIVSPTLVAYQNIAAGSTVTLSTTSNFELVPNALIRSEVETHDSPVMPEAQNMMAIINSGASQLGLRSIYNKAEYERILPNLLETAVINRHDANLAMGVGDVAHAFKKYALPLMYAAAPETKMIVDGTSALYNRFASLRNKAMQRESSRLISDKFIRLARTSTPDLHSRLTPPGVLFPCIRVDSNDQFVAVGLWLAALGDHRPLINRQLGKHFTPTGDGFKIYGWSDSSTDITPGNNMTLIPVRFTPSGVCVVDEEMTYPVEERSCDLSIALSAAVRPTSTKWIAFSGVLEGTSVQSVGAFEQKLIGCLSHNVPLFGHDSSSPVDIVDLMSAISVYSCSDHLRVYQPIRHEHRIKSMESFQNQVNYPHYQVDVAQANQFSAKYTKCYGVTPEITIEADFLPSGCIARASLVLEGVKYSAAGYPSKATAKTALMSYAYTKCENRREPAAPPVPMPEGDIFSQFRQFSDSFRQAVLNSRVCVLYDAGVNDPAISGYGNNIICAVDSSVQKLHATNNVSLNNGRNDSAEVCIFLLCPLILKMLDNPGLIRFVIVSKDKILFNLVDFFQSLNLRVEYCPVLPEIGETDILNDLFKGVF